MVAILLQCHASPKLPFDILAHGGGRVCPELPSRSECAHHSPCTGLCLSGPTRCTWEGAPVPDASRKACVTGAEHTWRWGSRAAPDSRGRLPRGSRTKRPQYISSPEGPQLMPVLPPRAQGTLPVSKTQEDPDASPPPPLGFRFHLLSTSLTWAFLSAV